jgi:hypothetical protein
LRFVTEMQWNQEVADQAGVENPSHAAHWDGPAPDPTCATRLKADSQLTDPQISSAPSVEQTKERRTRDQRCRVVRLRQQNLASDLVLG